MKPLARFNTCLVAFMLAAAAGLHCEPSWSAAEDGRSGSATSGTEEYLYDLDVILDPVAFTGPLKYSDSSSGLTWIYNAHANPESAYGQWYWKIDENQWSYSIATGQWQLDGGTKAWNHTALRTWQSAQTSDTWLFSFTPLMGYDTTWWHQITDQADETFTEKWGYTFDTKVWRNITRSISWVFDYTSFEWTNQDNPEEVWRVDPTLETITLIGESVEENRWRFIEKNRWVEENSGVEWLYIAPGEDIPSGTWQNTTTGEFWNFDTLSQAWLNDDEDSAYLPPLFPPLLITQVEVVFKTAHSAISSISDYQTPTGELVATLTDGSTLRQSDSHFKLHLNTLDVDVGRGTSYGFASSLFQTSEGERWDVALSPGDGTGSIYINASTGISVGDQVRHKAATGQWSREEPMETPLWQCDIESGQWTNSGSPQTFTFNYQTLIWTEVGFSSQWEYLNNGSAWVWRHSPSGVEWRYVVRPLIYASSADNVWHNTDTDEYWVSNGTTVETKFRRLNDYSTWEYNPGTGLWAKTTGFPESEKVLFPLLPPTMAGIDAFLGWFTLQDTTSTSPYAPEAGLLTRLTARKAVFETLESQVASIKSTYQGLAQYNNLLPAITDLIDCYYHTLWLAYEYNNLYLAYNLDPLWLLPEGDTFSLWLGRRGFFSQPGKGAFRVGFSTVSGALPHGKVGFAASPTTDGSATFSLEFRLATEDDELFYVIRVYQGETLLVSQRIVPALEIDTNFFVSFDDGHIKVMTGAPLEALLVPNGSTTLLDYTIEDTETASTMRFATCATVDGEAATALFVPYLYDFFSVQQTTVDLINNCTDCLTMAPFEEIWLSLKQILLTMATVDVAAHAKKKRAQEAIDLVLGTSIVAKPLDTVSYLVADHLLTTTSRPQILRLFQEINGLAFILGGGIYEGSGYLEYDARLNALEDSFTALLTADPSTLDAAAADALISDAKEAATDIINIAYSNIGNILTTATVVGSLPDNEDLTPFTQFFTEEGAFLFDLGAALANLDPLILERFEQQTALYEDGSAATKAGVAAKEAARQTSRLAIINLLATRIADGSSTLFSTLLAASIVLCVNNKFDDIRALLNSYLTENGYTDFHLFPEEGAPLRTQATAAQTLRTILDAVEPLIAIGGSIFYGTFEGGTTTPQTKVGEAYLQQTISTADAATLLQQQKTATAGSSTYLKNIFITTQDDEHVTNTVREIVTPDIDKTAAYSRLYAKESVIGIGNANLSTASDYSLSVFGAAEITPDGSAVLQLNSDIFITGNNFLRPSGNFGSDPLTATRCIPGVPAPQKGKHSIIFHADSDHCITLTSGSTLDLTSFGQGPVTGGQRIVFSGKASLVIEPGARIRLPYTAPDEADYALEIVFKDDTQLIFQGLENYDDTRWVDALTGPDTVRSKLLGTATFTFSGRAKASILRSALVGIEADYTTNITNISVVLNDQSQWQIGTESIAGGGFQVGNIQEGGSNSFDPDNYPNNTEHPRYGDLDDPFIPRPTQVDFSLTLGGANARFYIGRQGFVGFGVGTVNKKDNINGDLPNKTTDPLSREDEYNTWSVQSLKNTGNITLNLMNGCFWHHSVASGDSSEASLLAIGPLIPRANYKLLLNKTKSNVIMGGGNVLFLRGDVSSPLPLSIWDTIEKLSGGTSDNGKYSLLAPAPLVMLRKQVDSARPGIKKYGRAAVQEDASSYLFTGPQDEFYLATTLQKQINNSRYVIGYNSSFSSNIAFVDSTNSIKTAVLTSRSVKNKLGRYVAPPDAVSQGHLRATRTAPTKNNLTVP